MMRRAPGADCGYVIEVHSFSREKRRVMLPRLHRALAKSGCWMMESMRHGRRMVKYSFELELRAVLELYCGLVQAGMEMTEGSHRALTELCVLRTHERLLRGIGRAVSVRLMVCFVEAEEEMEVAAAMAASA